MVSDGPRKFARMV